MNKSRALMAFTIPLAVAVIAAGVYWQYAKAPEVREIATISQITVTKGTMRLASSAFEHNQPIPSRYTCDGENVNPPLSITEVPEGAASLALIVHDPDAPAKDWVHWTVWNVPPSTVEIGENSVPSGVEGMTDMGETGYGGPCPPSGTHRYFFELYALDTELPLDASKTRADMENAMEGHVVEKAELIGTYKRR